MPIRSQCESEEEYRESYGLMCEDCREPLEYEMEDWIEGEEPELKWNELINMVLPLNGSSYFEIPIGIGRIE